MAEILLVEDEHNARRVIGMGLEASGHRVHSCANADEALAVLEQKCFDLVLTDLRMQGRDAGLEVVKAASALEKPPVVLLITAYASTETAVNAMRFGAFDYLTKPVSMDELEDAIVRALSSQHAVQEDSSGSDSDARKKTSDNLLIGQSPVMQRIRERLQRAARRDVTVLLTGESGTGKEVAARFVHCNSPRAGQPFVPVHCAAIPEGLFESELFGHCKGAFTSAEVDRKGLVEAAHGGTLFLDEIGEMPLNIQVKLLRLLQEHCFRRVGEDIEREADVRILAATNRDLAEEVRQGNFREDLFYRLNVVPVHLPPLRQRKEDIPLLVRALLQHMGENVEVGDDVISQLCELPLPGNVRELENLLQRLLALSDEGTLDLSVLDEIDTPPMHPGTPLDELSLNGQNLDDVLENIERTLIAEAMERTDHNATLAARELGISFRSMRYRLKKLGLRE